MRVRLRTTQAVLSCCSSSCATRYWASQARSLWRTRTATTSPRASRCSTRASGRTFAASYGSASCTASSRPSSLRSSSGYTAPRPPTLTSMLTPFPASAASAQSWPPSASWLARAPRTTRRPRRTCWRLPRGSRRRCSRTARACSRWSSSWSARRGSRSPRCSSALPNGSWRFPRCASCSTPCRQRRQRLQP